MGGQQAGAPQPHAQEPRRDEADGRAGPAAWAAAGGLLAGAAALLALAAASARVARAADGEPLLLGRPNEAAGTTALARSDSGGRHQKRGNPR